MVSSALHVNRVHRTAPSVTRGSLALASALPPLLRTFLQLAIVSTAFAVPTDNARATPAGLLVPTAPHVRRARAVSFSAVKVTAKVSSVPTSTQKSILAKNPLSVCQLGCTQCADGTGTCITCQSGFTQNANDRTKCIAPQSVTSSGTPCPDGSFSNGATCNVCSPSCKTCSGSTSNSCILCATGTYKFNGSCVSADGNGVCTGSSLIADNNKQECDSTRLNSRPHLRKIITPHPLDFRLSCEMHGVQDPKLHRRFYRGPASVHGLSPRLRPQSGNMRRILPFRNVPRSHP